MHELRYSFRSLRKSPVFTAVAVLSLALGIGANTAIFTLLDQILLRVLPVKDPQQLVLLRMRGRQCGAQVRAHWPTDDVAQLDAGFREARNYSRR